jgi:hypothetical protein
MSLGVLSGGMGLRTIRTPENRANFLEAVRNTGNVVQACNSLGLARTAVYAWRDADPSFADDWEAALALGMEALEDEARRRAFAGSDLLMIFMLKGHKPDKYRDRSTVDLNQTVTHDLRRVPMDELRKRLAQLRAEQGAGPQLTIEGSLDGNVVPIRPTDTETD